MLASASVAAAQTPPDAVPGPAPAPMMAPAGAEAGHTCTLSVRQVAAIGAGAVVGATLFGVAIGHGVVVVGALLGGWAGDWYYGTHMAQPAHAGT
jgi:hypothetical protein